MEQLKRRRPQFFPVGTHCILHSGIQSLVVQPSLPQGALHLVSEPGYTVASLLSGLSPEVTDHFMLTHMGAVPGSGDLSLLGGNTPTPISINRGLTGKLLRGQQLPPNPPPLSAPALARASDSAEGAFAGSASAGAGGAGAGGEGASASFALGAQKSSPGARKRPSGPHLAAASWGL